MEKVREAVSHYGEYPDEMQQFIAANEQEAEQLERAQNEEHVPGSTGCSMSCGICAAGLRRHGLGDDSYSYGTRSPRMVSMAPRTRILAFGSAGLLVIAGAVCAAILGGGTGQILALVLIGLGFVAATSLVFLEVGLSEDRALAREERERHQRGSQRRRVASKQSRLERMRGQRRRLG
jgi:hypothetical protein